MGNKEVISVDESRVIELMEQYTFELDEEVQLYVVYTYYDKDWNLLHIDGSKAFFKTHLFNNIQFKAFEKVEYVGFIFLEDEKDMIIVKKDMKENPQSFDEDFIVSRVEMDYKNAEYWAEHTVLDFFSK